ncbi:MAG TPA: DUF1330 domain-containing protein [Herpetosiphonaceae bacterium]
MFEREFEGLVRALRTDEGREVPPPWRLQAERDRERVRSMGLSTPIGYNQGMSVYYLVSIVLHPGMGDVLRQYEFHAAPIMQRHGGQFVYVLKPMHALTNDAADEIHLLVFESEQGFLDFRQDPDLHQYRHLREAAVKHAQVVPLQAISLTEYLTPAES